MNWWLIFIVAVLILIVFKFKELRHKLGFVIVISVILFLIASFSQIYVTEDLKLNSFDGIVHAGRIYFSWLGNAAGNLADIGSYAVKQDWDAEINETKAK